jgi:hypothetical protein
MKLVFLVLALVAGLGAARAELVRQPLNGGVACEYGQISHAIDFFTSPQNVDQFTLHKTVGWFVQKATLNERFDITVGMGAMFFYFFPEEGYDYSRSPQSAVSLTDASGAYTFGDMREPAVKLSFGLMPYKYNQDSKNLGEYLFRSTPYPSTTVNGGWETVNSSRSKIWGAVLEKNLFDGKWKNNLLATMSTVFPLYDISPAFITSYTFGGMLELGAGVNFSHLIPNQSKVTTPRSKGIYDAYFTYQGNDYYANDSYYKKIASFYADPAQGNDPQKAAELNAKAALVDSLNKAPIKPTYGYYTVQGTEVMGRFSLDFKPILGEKVDLKIYGEACLLGVKNYPVFYGKPLERTPIMLGVNIPTFGLLDQLGVEVEYWTSPYVNDYASESVTGWTVDAPVPDYVHEVDGLHIDPSKPYRKDDLKWSFSAKKCLGPAFSAYVQIARDHIRPVYALSYNPLASDILLDDKGWYYAFRIQMGI